MAHYEASYDPMTSYSTSFAEAIGGGLNKVLSRMSQRKQNQPAFEAAGFSPEQARAFADADQKTLATLMRGMRSKGAGKKSSIESTMIGLMGAGVPLEEAMMLSHLDPKILSEVMRDRYGFQEKRRENPLGEQIKTLISDYRQQQLERSFTPKKGESKELTPKAIDYFIRKASGDAERAREMARKAGFIVSGAKAKKKKATRRTRSAGGRVSVSTPVTPFNVGRTQAPFSLNNLLSM